MAQRYVCVCVCARACVCVCAYFYKMQIKVCTLHENTLSFITKLLHCSIKEIHSIIISTRLG